MGVDIVSPPYAYLKKPPYGSKTDIEEVAGVGPDMIKAMAAHCGFEVSVVEAHWSDCWGNNEIGQGLLQGWYHGCMTYTHAAGVRNRYLEFTDSWALLNKPSGLIVKLENGVPKINGQSDMSGKTIVDVTGWAPTADTLYFVNNQCTDTKYSGFTVVQGDDIDVSGTYKGPNDRALRAVLEDKADAMWIYADQAANYHCAPGDTQDGWDCDLWAGFGTTFAYVQTGMFGWMNNGTTVAMARKGSGIAEYLDTCFADFQKTEEFYKVCSTMHDGHSQLQSCIPNDFIKADPAYTPKDVASSPYMFPTKDLTGSHTCATGYCSCSE
uniref:Solute-binding protein family 3/N-terminal domain-containing protein n=1 Tax=Haptolina brevifila TaxID=156173 RepID=A0A7S2MGM4_9EUKA|mmetsp:Transcript_51763/g.103024  ORF Transcript_51763/g.103024 Transcript_51763/m.103024 type:complete len:324 (+) Transcript_51763:3-974(+)